MQEHIKSSNTFADIFAAALNVALVEKLRIGPLEYVAQGLFCDHTHTHTHTYSKSNMDTNTEIDFNNFLTSESKLALLCVVRCSSRSLECFFCHWHFYSSFNFRQDNMLPVASKQMLCKKPKYGILTYIYI